MYDIVGREDFSGSTFLLEVAYPLLAKAARPGQFVIVMSQADGERIPLTIADFSVDRGTVTLVIQAVGKTTMEMQQRCIVGSTLYALVGPMGIPSHIGESGKVVCVGGGLGVAPVYPQARAFKEKGAYVIGIIGFRSKDLIFWQDRFEKGLRRVDHLHRRRFGGNRGSGDRRHPHGYRQAPRHRRGRRHRAAGDDEILRRGNAAPRHQDHRELEPDHG